VKTEPEVNLFAGVSVCVVGNLNRDVKVHPVPGSSALLEDGESSVAGVSETVGGGGANSACAAAALGARVHFLSKVGADRLGRRLRLALERHGVRTHLARDQNSVTGTTVVLDFDSGHRHFLSCLPNCRTLEFKDLELACLPKCDHLLRADVWFSRPMLEGGNERLLARARKLGLATSLDINFDPEWSGGAGADIRRRKKLLRTVLPLVDMAHGNVRELCEFTDRPNLDSALKQLGKWGVGSVVVHLGRRGAGFYQGGELRVEPASPARRVVHATGTGDVLSVCMILLSANDRLSLSQKLRLSNCVVRDYIEGFRSFLPELSSKCW
jgi:sugar/nucleoside kinase (ribokinase family)